MVLRKKLKLCLTKKIYSEYQEVLSRKKFKKLDQEAVKKLLTKLKKEALFFKPHVLIDIIKKDLPDNKFLECALSAKADYLITGNTRHFSMGDFQQTKILTPTEFASIFISSFFPQPSPQ